MGRLLRGTVSAGGLPVNTLADGRVIIIAPIDALAWSETPLQALAAVSSELRRRQATKVELHITGQATPAARDGLKGMGWTLVEGARF